MWIPFTSSFVSVSVAIWLLDFLSHLQSDFSFSHCMFLLHRAFKLQAIEKKEMYVYWLPCIHTYTTYTYIRRGTIISVFDARKEFISHPRKVFLPGMFVIDQGLDSPNSSLIIIGL